MSNTRTEIPLDGSAVNVAPANMPRMQNPFHISPDSSFGLSAPQQPVVQAQPAPMPQPVMPINEADLPETLTNPVFVPGFLAQNLGKLMRVEFLVGNNTTDRVGRLIEVGASYILLQSLEHGSSIMCDLFSIKFVTIVDSYYPGSQTSGLPVLQP